MSKNFPTFQKLFHDFVHCFNAQKIKKIIWIIIWFWAVNFIIKYTDLPLSRYVGIDWDRHFSLPNYLIDFLIWAGVLYVLHRFWRPIFKLSKLQLFIAIVILTIFFVSATLLVYSPLRKSWDAGGPWLEGGSIFLKEYQIPNQGASTTTDTRRGFPYNFYHHSTGYSKNNQILWDFKILEMDNLYFDLFFWFVASLIVSRIVYFKKLYGKK